MNSLFLNTKPLKNIPKGLIYRIPKTNVYKLADVRNCRYVGKMIAGKKAANEFYDINPLTNNTLHIYSLEIRDKFQGWGSCMINFAKQESYNRKCGGRISLVAYNTELSPHVFYKKLGFVSKDNDMNKYLDKCISKGYNPTYLPAEKMFLPVKNKKEKTFALQFLEIFSKIFQAMFPKVD